MPPKRPVPPVKVKVKTRPPPPPQHGEETDDGWFQCPICSTCATGKEIYCADCAGIIDRGVGCSNCMTICATCGSSLCPVCRAETQGMEFPCGSHRHCPDCQVRHRCHIDAWENIPTFCGCDSCVEPKPMELIWRSKQAKSAYTRSYYAHPHH